MEKSSSLNFPFESDTQGDFTQQHVLNLQALKTNLIGTVTSAWIMTS